MSVQDDTKYLEESLYSKYIPLKVGKRLDSGCFGYVYALLDYPDRILKVSRSITKIREEELKSLFEKLVGRKCEKISQLYEYNFFEHKKNRFFYYVAEKLKPLSYGKYLAFEKEHICHTNKWVKCVSESPKLHYFDFHNGNVLKSKRGNPKICDLDGFIDNVGNGYKRI